MSDMPHANPSYRRISAAVVLTLTSGLASVLSAPSPEFRCQLADADCSAIAQALVANRLAEAAAIAERALRTAESTAGAESLEAARASDMLVACRIPLGRGREPETITLAEGAVTIRTRLHGESDPDLIESLHNLGLVMRQAGDFKRSLKLVEEAVRIAEVHLAPDHPVTAHCLTELSSAQLAAGDPPAALASAQRALSLAEKMIPVDPRLLGEALSVVAAARFMRGEPAAAEPLFRRALDLREAALGPEHHLVARTAMNLGMALRATGEREEGERMLQRALAIFERVAPSHPDTPSCLNSLALVARSRGEYAEARRLWERALEIGERVHGEEHPTVAGVLNNLANLRKNMGDYAAAQALLERCLAIRERVRGPNHPEVAQALTNLAAVQSLAGRHFEAVTSAKRAVVIREKVFGPEAPQVGASLVILGDAMARTGNPDQVLPVFRRAVDILQRAGSAGSLDLASATHGLAIALAAQGGLAEAADLCARSLSLHEELLDPGHPRVGEVLLHLGLITAQRGDLAGAMSMTLRAEQIAREHLRLTSRSLSEREALAYAEARARGLDLALSLVAAFPEIADAATVFAALVRSRTLVLDEAMARNLRLNQAASPELDGLQKDVTEAAQELATLVVRGPGREGPEKYRQNVAAARERVEQAERALAEHPAAERLVVADVSWPQVRDGLAAGSAVVAFARYTHQPVTGSKGDAGIPSYLAFVLPAGSRDLVVVPLGPAAPIEEALRAWEVEISRGRVREPHRAADVEISCRAAGQKVRRAIWDPIAVHLKEADTVFVVPDGVLHLANFGALPREGGGYLIETRPVLYHLTAEKDLLNAPRGGSTGVGLLALGGAAFDRRAASEPGALVRAVTDRPTCPEFQTIRFAPLANTGAEVREVGRVFRRAETTSLSKVTVLRGQQATEAAFRALAPGKRVLHLATHGFFLGEQCRLTDSDGRGIGGLVSTTELAPASHLGDSPLRLAGLALAGANQRGTAASSADDGILTAEEIALLDLAGVEWAVLSACDSGAGTVATGEGVLGLRRAFQIAGVRSVVMSLWAVEDAAAREWMSALYEARMGRGLSTAGAVREASLQILQQRRLKGLSTHPFFWAGFVSAGDWR